MAGREDLRSMQEAWRAYLDLAMGLTETSRKRATKVAKKLVGRGNATAEQLQTMAEELISTSMANREAITRLVRFELDRALGRVGLATAEEVSELTTRLRELEQELSEARAAAATVPATTTTVGVPVGAAGPVKAVRKVAKKTVAKKTAAKKAAAALEPSGAGTTATAAKSPRVTVRKSSTGDAVVKVTPSRVVAKKTGSAAATPSKATPSKATPSKALAKKAVAKKAVAKKTAPGAASELYQGEA
jgi:polyhydroxyalkanoate synthesis regulator phasin